MKVLSVIIPAYNSARYLRTVVASLLQDEVLGSLDIIVVNDGSTDETPAVALEYCTRYPDSVRLINQVNKGHGGALNTGCAAAVGKYLKVVDADDWVETQNLPEFLRLLHDCESDVVLTHHYTRDISTGETKNWMSYPPAFGRAYTLGQILPQWKNFDRSLTFHGITYRTAFYREHSIRLSEHVFYEDHEFASFPCCYAESVTPFDLFIYDYRIGDVCQSVSNDNQLRRLSHTETVLRRLSEEYGKLTLPEDADGRSYVRMKAQGLLLSYLATVLLVEPDRRKGRAKAAQMMAYFKANLPGTYTLAVKQYRVFCIMNRLHMTQAHWAAIQDSKLYNTLRHRHGFHTEK